MCYNTLGWKTLKIIYLTSPFLSSEYNMYVVKVKTKVKQSHYSPGEPRGFQEVKVPRFHDNGTGWW